MAKHQSRANAGANISWSESMTTHREMQSDTSAIHVTGNAVVIRILAQQIEHHLHGSFILLSGVLLPWWVLCHACFSHPRSE
jgi:hypothetical protein